MALSLKIKIHDFRKLVVAYTISAFNTLQAVIDRLKKKVGQCNLGFSIIEHFSEEKKQGLKY